MQRVSLVLTYEFKWKHTHQCDTDSISGIVLYKEDWGIKDKVPEGVFLANDTSLIVIVCFNSDFVTNDFYLPWRQTSQLISLYYLWAVMSQKTDHD